MAGRDLADEYVRLMMVYDQLIIEHHSASAVGDKQKLALLQRTLRRLASTIKHVRTLAGEQNRGGLMPTVW